MNWSKAASAICDTAQFLGGLSSGPVGMSVTAMAIFLSQMLGVSDRSSLANALADSNEPENERDVQDVDELEQLAVTADTPFTQEPDEPLQYVGGIALDWTTVASTIGPTAPLLASLVGGPIELCVATASSILCHVLGTSNDPSEIETALTDPAALERVRQAESAISVQLQRLAVTAAHAQLVHEVELARVEPADRNLLRATATLPESAIPALIPRFHLARPLARHVSRVSGAIGRLRTAAAQTVRH